MLYSMQPFEGVAIELNLSKQPQDPNDTNKQHTSSSSMQDLQRRTKHRFPSLFIFNTRKEHTLSARIQTAARTYRISRCFSWGPSTSYHSQEPIPTSEFQYTSAGGHAVDSSMVGRKSWTQLPVQTANQSPEMLVRTIYCTNLGYTVSAD